MLSRRPFAELEASIFPTNTMRVTETTPLLAQPSSSRLSSAQDNNLGETNDILCPHPSSHRLHIKLVLARRAKKDAPKPSPHVRLSVITEEEEEADSQSEEADNSIGEFDTPNSGTSSSDEEELDTSEEQTVYFQPVMVPIVVQPRDTQPLEEDDTWEVGCASSMCWPLIWLFRKLDTAADEQDGPWPTSLLGAQDSDAEFADDEYSSSIESSGSSSASSTFPPPLALLMPAVQIPGQQSEVRVSSA
ncbi:hypothetical protein CDV36_007440 [Fusarium kuroshium]|uniref:Uncharacterized protein n=1 Tax=Fusarium kuroshium TaxID=2010991 RepID=A0A3M2S5X7_9HYPO|nr:hypothetical protein CDV36_007440 [Fusarium kuroshium]